MSLSFLSHISLMHTNFFKEIKYSAQFDANPISILPSVFFLIGSFFILHRLIHRRTHPSTPLHIWIYREFGFHWTYFYIIRVWLLTLKLIRLGAFTLELKIKNSPEKFNYITPLNVHLFAYITLVSISLFPAVILFFTYKAARNIPNFLMWVGEDPWLHSEIGIAGHYLDRPPNFTLPRRLDCAYRIHRSTSYENVTEKLSITRNSRSAESIKCVKRIEELFN